MNFSQMSGGCGGVRIGGFTVDIVWEVVTVWEIVTVGFVWEAVTVRLVWESPSHRMLLLLYPPVASLHRQSHGCDDTHPITRQYSFASTRAIGCYCCGQQSTAENPYVYHHCHLSHYLRHPCTVCNSLREYVFPCTCNIIQTAVIEISLIYI